MENVLLKSTRIYTEDGLVKGAIEIADGRVLRIIKDDSSLESLDDKIIDYGDNRVIPGIIDLHNHGFGGCSCFTRNKVEIKAIAKALVTVGVTGFQPTTGNDEQGLECIGSVMDEEYRGARILGIHMEGPFMSSQMPGAFKKEEIIKPSVEKMSSYWQASKGKITYMTLAPEVPGAFAVMKYLQAKGIIIGAGHTNANSQEMKEAIQRGVQISIHTGNAMRGMHQRDVGTLGAVLLDDNIYCELIADFFHICPDMIRIMFRIKDKGRFVLVSDSSQLSGVKPGKYEMLGQEVFVEESGLVHLADGKICGSSKYVLFGIQNLVENLGLRLEEVLRMSSLNPAALLKIDNQKGSIKPGKDADIVVIDDKYKVIATYVEGQKAYEAG